MLYTSTRNKKKKYSFFEVLFSGVAPDGGLFYPEKIPYLTKDEINSFSKKSYFEIAQLVLGHFLSDEINKKDLNAIVKKTYQSNSFFKLTPRQNNPLRLRKLKGHAGRAYFLELFHGPTLAFKDFALQFLANLMDYYLKKENKKIIILGATSGDTGSATIEAFKKIKQANIFIIHPDEAVSLKQRLQMTTVLSANVFNLALLGNFDDCQSLVKKIFRSHKTIGDYTLVSVNSINFVRLMAQIVYYFFAYSRIKDSDKKKGLDFIVPTGNFGNVFAGYLAKKMGLPIKNLVVATNENDVLDIYFKQNIYQKKKLVKTYSPSMDIVVSSNFERLIFDITDRNDKLCQKTFKALEKEGRFSLDLAIWQEIKKNFSSLKTTKRETLNLIEKIFDEQGLVVEPHSGTGLKYFYQKKLTLPSVALGTAHPAKFDEVYTTIKPRKPITYSDPLKVLLKRKENYFIVENSLKAVLDFIKKNSV